MKRLTLIFILSALLNNTGYAQTNSSTDLLQIGGFNKNAANLKRTPLLLKRILLFLRHKESLSKYSFRSIINAFILSSPSKEQKILLLTELRNYSNMSSIEELSQYLEINYMIDAKSINVSYLANTNKNNLYPLIKQLFDSWLVNEKINTDFSDVLIKNEIFISDFNKKFLETYAQLYFQKFWLSLYESIISKQPNSPELVTAYLNVLNSNLKYKKTVAYYENNISKNIDLYMANKTASSNGTIFLKISHAYSHLGQYSKARKVLKDIPKENLDELSKKVIELDELHIQLNENVFLENSVFDKAISNFDEDFKNFSYLFKASAYLSRNELDKCKETLKQASSLSEVELNFWRDLILIQCSKNLKLKEHDELVALINRNHLATKNLTVEYDFWKLFALVTSEIRLKSKEAEKLLVRIKELDTSDSHFHIAVDILIGLNNGIKNNQKLEQLGALLGKQHTVYTEISSLMKL